MLPAIAMSTAMKNCLLSLMSDWMVGKLVAPANANIVVLKADNICSSTVLYKKYMWMTNMGYKDTKP
jgi:hypothetical protein